MPNNKKITFFSPGNFHSPNSTLTLTLRTHTITTVHNTQSHILQTLKKTSVCVCLQNINKEPSRQVGVLYTESCGLLSGLNICNSLRGQKGNWYIIRAFWTLTGITLVFVLKVVRIFEGWIDKFWIINVMKILRKRDGKSRACAQCEKREGDWRYSYTNS